MYFGSIAGKVMRVKAFLPFLQGVPARYTELHRAYTGWLVGKTQVSSPLAIQDMPYVVLCNGLSYKASSKLKLDTWC